MQTTRGIRNCNPLNIRASGERFMGEVVPSRDPLFKQFRSMAYGYRAAFVILGTYLGRGINTAERIIRTWAPPSENDTAGYIAHVETWSGVDRHKPLTAMSGGDYRRIVSAMSRMECGTAACAADVAAGFLMQTRLKG